MSKLLKQFNKEYDFLYEAGDKEAGAFAFACEVLGIGV